MRCSPASGRGCSSRRQFGAQDDGAVARRSDALVLVGVLAPLVAVSMLFMAGRDRPDMLVYGRYNEAVLWPVVGVGAVWSIVLLRAGRRGHVIRRFAMMAALSVVLTVFVAVRSDDALRGPGVVRLMISGAAVLADPGSGAFLWLACGLSLGIAGVVLLALDRTRRAPLITTFLLVGVVLGLGVRSWPILSRNLNTFAEVSNVSEVTDMVPPGEPIGFHFVPVDEPSLVLMRTQRQLVQLYQMYLPGHRIDVDMSVDDDVGPYVFAPRGHDSLVEAGAEVVWLDERTGMALWREP